MNRAPRGMILAAGYGTRLAPITDHIPKPLLPVGGRPLLDHIIASFDRAGVSELAVNVHHLGDQVVDYLRSRSDANRFSIFRENEILGTGGALDGAREFLAGSDSFLLHNGDVLCDVDLAALANQHQEMDLPLATLLLVDWPKVNSVELDENSIIRSIANLPKERRIDQRQDSPVSRLTYAGVGAFSARILDDIGPGFSSLIDPLVRSMVVDPKSVRGFHSQETNWDDLGTLPRLLKAQPESAPKNTSILERITGHGSDRRFWRIKCGQWSTVAMQGLPDDPEFERQISIGQFLFEQGLGSPEILSVHEEEKVLLTEDLGSERLFELAGSCSSESNGLYEMALDHLIRLQQLTKLAKLDCPLAVDRCLDHRTLRWETDYFRDQFLVRHEGLKPDKVECLDDDFEKLATIVAAQPSVVIHRDFQSQNIHVSNGEIRLVDFQGMRLGPLGYDAASVIFDPYVDLGHIERSALLEEFAMVAGSANNLPEVEIRAMVLSAGLQRLMQALGAFGFLGHQKGKQEFLLHIPAGVSRLREVLSEIEIFGPSPWLPDSLPTLGGLLHSLGRN